MTTKEWVKNELSLSYDCLTTTDRIMLNKVLQDLDLLNYLIKLAEVKKGKIVIEIDKETNFETYTKIKEGIINE